MRRSAPLDLFKGQLLVPLVDTRIQPNVSAVSENGNPGNKKEILGHAKPDAGPTLPLKTYFHCRTAPISARVFRMRLAAAMASIDASFSRGKRFTLMAERL